MSGTERAACCVRVEQPFERAAGGIRCRVSNCWSERGGGFHLVIKCDRYGERADPANGCDEALALAPNKMMVATATGGRAPLVSVPKDLYLCAAFHGAGLDGDVCRGWRL